MLQVAQNAVCLLRDFGLQVPSRLRDSESCKQAARLGDLQHERRRGRWHLRQAWSARWSLTVLAPALPVA
jgi:hypothetical protein